jgi:hypothetical protein
VWVTCEVAKGGKPYSVPENQVVQITFYAVDVKDENGQAISGNQPYPAATTGEGKYEIPGPDGRGIMQGKYRVSVIQTPKSSTTAPAQKSRRLAPDRDHDYLEDRFGPTTSPIVRTVEKSSHLIIDLDRPTE